MGALLFVHVCLSERFRACACTCVTACVCVSVHVDVRVGRSFFASTLSAARMRLLAASTSLFALSHGLQMLVHLCIGHIRCTVE